MYTLSWEFDFSHFNILRQQLGRGISQPTNPLTAVVLGESKFFSPPPSPPSPGEFQTLNDDQVTAVVASLHQIITLIDSGPGCGKTEAASYIAREQVKLGRRVALVCATNSAVDEIASRTQAVLDGIPVSRVYAATVATDARSTEMEDFMGLSTVDKEKVRVFAATPVSFCKININTDVVLFDEASCLNHAEVSAVLRNVKTSCIFLGDSKQGKPFVQSRRAKELNFQTSTFAALVSKGLLVHQLSAQHRMHPAIAKVPNQVIYMGRLTDGVAALDRESPFDWEQNLPLKIVSVVGGETRHVYTFSTYNRAEALAVVQEVKALLQNGVALDRIVVLSYYRAQLDEVRKYTVADRELLGLSLATVQSYQGKESDYVILSLSRSNLDNYTGL